MFRIASYSALLTLVMSNPVSAAENNEQCLKDLNSLPAFILENDAGGKALYEKKGKEYFDHLLDTARIASAASTDNKACNKAISTYLKGWRNEHIYVKEILAAGTGSNVLRIPTFAELSEKTIVLTLPSFSPEYREAVLDILKSNRQALISHPNWIIDVRMNGGGSDTTYMPILPWLMENERLDIGGELLVTPTNIDAQLKACGETDLACKESLNAAAARMQAAEPGSYIAQNPKFPDGLRYTLQADLEPQRPQRVAVLVGKRCGSSCEQFLLAVRQSYQVKLIGQPSGGALDYSNLRRHDLPSGQRYLQYAITRTQRLPHLSVDAAGIMPDIYLPPSKDGTSPSQEVERVKRWLEGGSLRAD